MSDSSNIVFQAEAGGVLRGRVRGPGDKSVSHRSIMLGALAEGVTEVSGFLEGEDCLATIGACRAMGVRIDGPVDGRVTVRGVGLHGLRAPSEPLYMGNSGTSMRLLAGLMGGQAFDVTMTGDAALTRRPMKRAAEPLRQMGALIETSPGGTPPLRISGGRRLRGIDYAMPVASAQVKSSLLLAGLYAEGSTCFTEPATTRYHTERMLIGFGYEVERRGNTVCVRGGGRLRATHIDVPADISSAAFFMVGAAIAPGSDLTLEHVGANPKEGSRPASAASFSSWRWAPISRSATSERWAANPWPTSACARAGCAESAYRKIKCRSPSTNSPRCSSRRPAPRERRCSRGPRSCA